MAYAISAKFETVRTLGFASIGAAYMGVGTALTHPARMIYVTNLTNAELMFSFDGVNDHLPLPENGYFIFDIMANKSDESGFFLGEGHRLYVKEIGNPTSGSVYFSIIYGD